jgi:hypothetical protein
VGHVGFERGPERKNTLAIKQEKYYFKIRKQQFGSQKGRMSRIHSRKCVGNLKKKRNIKF